VSVQVGKGNFLIISRARSLASCSILDEPRESPTGFDGTEHSLPKVKSNFSRPRKALSGPT
jgi:hypothetical protein